MGRVTLRFLLRLLLFICFVSVVRVHLYAQPLQWQVIGRLTEPRQLFKALPINRDTILIAGGYGYGNSGGQPTRNCEYININSRTIRTAPAMNIPRAEFVALTTSDSNIVVISGTTNTSYNLTPTIELYNRTTRTWSIIGNLIVPRFQHGAVFINNSEIAIIGGRRQNLSSIADAEIFNINTRQSRLIAQFPYAMNYPNVAVTSNSNLIVFSGRTGGQGSYRTPGVFTYNGILNRWDSTSTIPVNVYHPETIKLWQGRLFASGGSANETPNDFRNNTFIETNGIFNQTSDLQSIRVWHSVAQFASDSIISCGGQLNNLNGQKLCDWYNPTTGQTSVAPQMNTAHFNSQAVSVPYMWDNNGVPIKAKVVIISGMVTPSISTDTIEILAPVVQGCQTLDSVEKIINWNFDQGVSGFQTDYSVTSYNTSVKQCTVTTSVRGFNSGWSQCNDHTGSSGNGFMLLVNGADTPNQVVWHQNLTIKPFTLYKLSLWVTPVFADNPPRLRFYFNGVPDTTTFKPTGQTCNWQQYKTEWRSGNNTALQLSVFEEEHQFWGNDFAIDDISMKECVCKNKIKILSKDTFLCIGDSLSLNAEQGFAFYQWNNSALSRSIVVRDSGKYTVLAVDSNGCTATDTIIIRFHPKPNVVITGLRQLCLGDSIILSTLLDTNYMYQWYKNNLNSKISGATKNKLVCRDSGTYYVSAQNEFGCITIDSITIKFNPKPLPKILQSRTAFCIGDTLSLIVNKKYFSYKWSNNSSAAKITIQDSGKYSVVVSDSLGCYGYDTIHIKGIHPINPKITNSKLVLCDNDTARLEATSGFKSYRWSSGQTTQTIIIRGPGTYTVFAIDSNGCTGRDSTVLSYPPPPPGLKLTSSKQAVCLGDSAVLQVSSGYKNYEWSNGENKPKITITEPGNYYVYVRDSVGCRYSLAMYIAPSKFRITGYPKVACQGDVVTLKCPGSYSNFLWSTGEKSREINVTQSGTYKVTVLDMDSKCNSDSVTITFVPKPSAKISTTRTSFCGGDTLILRREKGQGESFWYPASSSSSDSLLVRSPGMYILGIKSSNGCWAYDTVQIKNTPPPTCTISANKQFLCDNDSLQLQANGTFKKYQWSTRDTTSSITVKKEGTYYVTVYTTEGCTTTAEYNVYVRLSPKVNITTDKLQICTGDTAILTANSDVNNVQYEWSDGTRNKTVKVSAPGTYYVTVTNQNGCSSMAKVTLQSRPSKQVLVSASHKVICGNNPVILTASNGFSTYLWSTGASQSTIIVNTPGIYTVEAKDSNGCSSINQYSIKYVPLPIVTIQSSEQYWCKGDAITLRTQDGFTAYKWSTGQSSSSVTIRDTGTYTVVVTDSNGCSSIGASITIKEARPKLQILSFPHDSVLTTEVNGIVCGTVKLYNPNNHQIILTQHDIHLLKNYELSLPLAQFPLIMLPTSTSSIAVCLSPQQEGMNYDSLILFGETRCADTIPITGIGMAIVLNGRDFCNLPFTGNFVKSQLTLSIVPNPVQNEISYILNGISQNVDYRVVINTITGEELQLPHRRVNQNQGTIDTSPLPNGMYVLQTIIGTERIKQLFVVVK